jgi:branched-chain amino acid transport system permease protein
MNTSATTTVAPVAGKQAPAPTGPTAVTGISRGTRLTYLVLLALALAAPMLGLYPVMGMKLLCFALFACAFNLLLGFTGLLSFGHAAFFGFAAYAAGWLIKAQGSACWLARPSAGAWAWSSA